MLLKGELRKFYENNREVVEDIVQISQNREVGYLLENMKFGNRPSVIENTGDIFNLIDKGAVSFHISLERWSNPLMLKEVKSKREMNDLRIGWDLILDIDSENIEVSKIIAREILDFLFEKDIKKVYIKYSGGKGFHIAIPWETFPERIEYTKKEDLVEEETKNLFPDLAREMALYIMEKTKERLEKRATYKYPEIFEKIDKDSISSLIKIDTIAISNRHLIRCLYSINEKTGRISIPIDVRNIEKFNPKYAEINNFVYEGIPFLTEEIKDGYKIERFLRDVINWKINNMLVSGRTFIETTSIETPEEEKIKRKLKIEKNKYKGKISEDLFPPCIKNILSGVSDGRKRSIFILINFLKNIGWEFDEINKKLIEWNNKLEDPLRERYIDYQIEWHKRAYSKDKQYLPPNCDNEMYYKEIGVCQPDEVCKYIKNPILYPYKKLGLKKESKK
ncbi:MAG: hypothetical protein BXU00_02700 [Candidatus Nanoclepta minutus]|uniref:DNA primase large subunit C-terminal domain-containing protein n=1 Tax=Candidatus Nanoclepta minutus TaxID=1940235 RepID=A0A397WMA1_9ARCH|nr:MAG: hypothetical protein BXU00_02700 [Candidatus Nanoclepta minutus]